MADELKWYVAHTYSGYENTVAASIEKSVEPSQITAKAASPAKKPVRPGTERPGSRAKATHSL